MGGHGTVIKQGDDVELASLRLPGLAFPCGRPSQTGTPEAGVSAHR